MPQVTSNLLMIRPFSFGFNEETATDNAFQSRPDPASQADISRKAGEEFDHFVTLLRGEGVLVTVIEDTPMPRKPDALFPNNWVSFHEDGTVITYPMYSAMRRHERRDDIIRQLGNRFKVSDRIRFESYEERKQYLEGTGSMVLDRENKIAYACLSERTNAAVLEDWSEELGYTLHTFHAFSQEKPIYHTNVMMAIASQLAVVCLECVPDALERQALHDSLAKYRPVLEISAQQILDFAGNMLAIRNSQNEELMVMSERARLSLTPEQVSLIEQHTRIVSTPLNTIEDIGGGSARCMIAEVFLEPK